MAIEARHLQDDADVMDVMDQHLRENVRLLLRVTGRLAQDLAVALGISPAGLSRRLAGMTDITSKEVVRIAAFFGVRIDRLYDDPQAIRERVLGGPDQRGRNSVDSSLGANTPENVIQMFWALEPDLLLASGQ